MSRLSGDHSHDGIPARETACRTGPPAAMPYQIQAGLFLHEMPYETKTNPCASFFYSRSVPAPVPRVCRPVEQARAGADHSHVYRTCERAGQVRKRPAAEGRGKLQQPYPDRSLSVQADRGAGSGLFRLPERGQRRRDGVHLDPVSGHPPACLSRDFTGCPPGGCRAYPVVLPARGRRGDPLRDLRAQRASVQ